MSARRPDTAAVPIRRLRRVCVLTPRRLPNTSMDPKKLFFVTLLGAAVTISHANLLDDLFSLVSSSSSDNELDQLMDEQDRLVRKRRQDSTAAPTVAPTFGPVGGYVCPTELFRRMDKCCKVPQLYPTDILNKCTGKNMLMQLPKGPRKGIRPVQLRLRKNFLITNPKNASIKSRIEDILAPEGYIDEPLMYSTMLVLVPPGPYQTMLYAYTRTECSGIASYGEFGASVYNMYGQKCLLSPFRMLRCIKRSMLLAYSSCPGQISTGQQCDLDRNYLRQCDIYSV